MSASSAFDLEGPLPTGTSLLEASAGTGKTYAIARLVSRYLAEGVATIDRLLVVSFSEASSRELRDRVRERLVADRDAASGGSPDSASGATAGATSTSEPDRLAHDRLDRALADFDGAMVTTIHAACQALLRELGTAADHERDAVVLPDPSDLVEEVVADLYVGRWGHAGPDSADESLAAPADTAPAALPIKKFRDLARVAALDPATPLVPDLAEVDGEARLSVEVAAEARAEVARRLRAGRLLTYDDMILRLDAALADPATADVALAHLRRRFAVVLVDEFQDTDPVQWRILRTAFHGHATLVLVGDPKQAIYGFRGADVHAYLDARRDATATATLPENHRSDPGVLEGLAALFGGAALGDPQIRVVPVRAALAGRRLDDGAPVRLCVLQRDGRSVNTYGIPVEEARAAIREDVARKVTGLLGGVALLAEPDHEPRAVSPGDIAVIVRTNAEAEAIRERLRAAGVPAVVSGRASVFLTPAAEAWQHLLEALEQPHRTGRVRRLAVGPLVGLTADALESHLDHLALQVRAWLRVLEERGVAALAERVHTDLRLPERLLAQPGGERLLTDLRHIAEVLHEEAMRSGLGLTALASWLHRRREEENDQTVERSRRLETDAAAVQVLTSHTSKGLEFPVVLAPQLWDHWGPKADHPRFHDRSGRRVRDVGGPHGPDHAGHVSANWEDDANEELRLAYVTLTRAAAQVITWWAPTRNSGSAPLTRLLLHDGPGTLAPLSVKIPNDDTALARFQARAAASGGALDVQVVPVDGPSVGVWTPPAPSAPDLRLAVLTRGLDLQWRRTSYSALTAAAHGATRGAGPAFGSDPDVAQKDDEAETAAPVDAAAGSAGSAGAGAAGPTAPLADDADAHLLGIPSPWHALPGGTGFGTLVHRILERYAPGDDGGGGSGSDDGAGAGPDRDADLAALVRIHARSPGLDVGALTEALRTAVSTPLGPLAGGRSWSQVPARDRLAELEFEIPLAGGDSPGLLSVAAGSASPGSTRAASGAGSATLAGLADLWRAHVPVGPLAGYADALDVLTAEGPAARLRGYLTGSIDAVVRMRSSRDGAGPANGAGSDDTNKNDDERYVVVDHKTNRLAAPDEPLTAWHYRATALDRAMIDAHYPLQALLYSVALHRYLRWRRRGYDPERHLGGVLYLFLRGMCGPAVLDVAGAAPGVFAWRPPAALVVATSDLLAGGSR